MRSSLVETSSSPSSFLFSAFLPDLVCALNARGSTSVEAAAAEPRIKVRLGVSMIHLFVSADAYFQSDEHARIIVLLWDGYRKQAAGNRVRRKTSPGLQARRPRQG